MPPPLRPMDLAAQLRSAITAQSLPPPSPSFLTSLLTARDPPPPLPSLLATAKTRLLACDITSSPIVDAAALAHFPPGTDSPTVRESRLPRDVLVQVLDVENLSVSRWEQVEELEAIERGERTRGRQVIRVTADEDAGGQESGANTGTQAGQTQTQTQNQNQSQSQSQNLNQTQAHTVAGTNATHRLVLQDRNRTRVFGIELTRIPRIGVGKTCIGEKILIRAGTQVARGTVLLAPDNCVLLGGKVDAWHDAWLQGRLERLREAVSGR